jgi:hypothetical protein
MVSMYSALLGDNFFDLVAPDGRDHLVTLPGERFQSHRQVNTEREFKDRIVTHSDLSLELGLARLRAGLDLVGEGTI